MSEAQRGLSPGLAALLTGSGFVALLIAGFGMLSLLTDAEVLPVAGLGQSPGAVGVIGAVVAYVATAWLSVRGPRPSYAGVVVIVVATFLAYLLGVLVGGVFSGVDAARAVAAVGGFATSWFAVVLASTALLAGWTAVALVRTRAGRPRWPWEREAR
jgi:hypothetical protein